MSISRQEAIELCQKNLEKSIFFEGEVTINIIYANQLWIMQALNIILEDMKE